ncbi:hypothetical protein [Pseudoalteromonas sp. PPB1]|uniref:hypothetical protein n=1 Tax=Pseudoalteromonas sp. PPB1 TaxID=2756136 RepID=UPI001890E30E|nr:hypothetical protein [Pseudoalteromonas sp. PPB1]
MSKSFATNYNWLALSSLLSFGICAAEQQEVSFTLQWSSVEGATHYLLEEGSRDGAWQSVHSEPIAEQKSVIRKNSHGLYIYRVSGCISDSSNTIHCGNDVAEFSDPLIIDSTQSGVFKLSLNAQGSVLSWTELPTSRFYQLETTPCASGCTDTEQLTWQAVSLSSNAARYDVSAQKMAALYRVRACFSDTVCSEWSNNLLYDPNAQTLSYEVNRLFINGYKVLFRLAGDSCKTTENGMYWYVDYGKSDGAVKYNLLKAAQAGKRRIFVKVPSCLPGKYQEVIDVYQDY